jgi:DNA repair exonuclease SbcCD ATPase subunit
MGATLNDGIRKDAAETLVTAVPGDRIRCVKAELESTRALDKLRAEIDEASDILTRSRHLLEFRPELLRTVIDEGLRMSGASELRPLGEGAFELPTLGDSWTSVLDGMRPTRGHDESEFEWREKPPRPVVFEAPEVWSDDFVHLHLEHPFVQRILSRFRAQGFSAHDLARVCDLTTNRDDTVRAVAVGRLSLFGPRATRLHDELIVVSAPWYEGARKGHLVPGGAADDRAAFEEIERILAELPKSVHREKKLEASLAEHAPKDFAALWAAVRTEADARTKDAETKLAARAREESAALIRLLDQQRRALEKTLRGEQLDLKFTESEKAEREQWEVDRERMRRRLEALPRERDEEARAIGDLYRVAKRRLLPVGLVYLWPRTR